MLKKVIAVITLLCTIFSFTACGEDNKKNILKNTPAVTNNLTASPVINTPSRDISGTQDATETDDNSTALQTAEPTVSNSPTTTMSNTTSNPVSTKTQTTSKPTVTGATNNERKSLQVIDLGFDSMLLTGNNKLICGKKGSYYGAMNLKGEVVIPFEYDAIGAPTPDGYITAWKNSTKTANEETIDVQNGYLFDSAGKLLYKTLSETSKKIFHTNSVYGESEYEYYATSGERLLFYNYGILLTDTNATNIEGRTIRTLNMRKVDGTLIKSFDDITGYCQFADGKLVVTKSELTDTDGSFYISDGDFFLVDEFGNTLKSYSHEWGGHDIYFASWAEGASGDYFYSYGTWYGSDIILSKNFDSVYEYETTAPFEYIDHYGTKVIYKLDDESYRLVDITKVDESDIPVHVESAIISKYNYEYMSFNSNFDNQVEYALVSRNGKWGYLSLNGETEKLYDDAGSFYRGKSIVKNGNDIYIINSDLEKISEAITGYDSVATFGENLYQVTKDGKNYLAIYTP